MSCEYHSTFSFNSYFSNPLAVMNGNRKKTTLAGTCLNEYIPCSWQRVTLIVIYRFVLIHFSYEKRSRMAYCFLFSYFSFMSFPRGDVFLTWITELLCKLLGFDVTSNR